MLREFRCNPGRRDIHSWKPSLSEEYRCKSFFLCLVYPSPFSCLVYTLLWNVKIPKKVKSFVWQTIYKRLNTLAKVSRRVVNGIVWLHPLQEGGWWSWSYSLGLWFCIYNWIDCLGVQYRQSRAYGYQGIPSSCSFIEGKPFVTSWDMCHFVRSLGENNIILRPLKRSLSEVWSFLRFYASLWAFVTNFFCNYPLDLISFIGVPLCTLPLFSW